MSKKSYIIYIILLILVVFGIGIMVYARFRTPSFEAAEQSESTDAVSNPYCGFYHLYGYQLSEEGDKPAKKWASSVLANDDNRIVLLQINLVNYKDKAISDSALAQLDSIITSFAAANKQIILRFLYDWNGNALQSEPSSIEQVSSHMDDVAPVVNAHKDAVFLLQGIFTGNCGEMNQTHYGSNDDIRILIKELSSVISPEIYLSVRTPAQLPHLLLMPLHMTEVSMPDLVFSMTACLAMNLTAVPTTTRLLQILPTLRRKEPAKKKLPSRVISVPMYQMAARPF